MYERIVVGTDGSDTAAMALERAALLATMCGAHVHLVYGAGLPVASGGVAGFDALVALPPDAIEELEQKLEEQAGQLREAGLQVTTHLMQTNGAEAIVRVATECEADLVVVGNRGMTGARRFFLGSVPNAVSHQAHCSVLVVRTDDRVPV